MTTAVFFDLFLEELKGLPELSHYYKFHASSKNFEFRKNYFLQRLDYVFVQVQRHEQLTGQKPNIWDLGCGYGTTCLFLAMNGYKTYGSTLEFYFKFLPSRLQFWSNYGRSDLFEAGYEDVFENQPQHSPFDLIILQDTLHHLEPIQAATFILSKALKPNGKLICIEENGDNIIQSMKLYKQRGNQRVITFWDEKLKKNIVMGNENIRSITAWDKLFMEAGLQLVPSQTEFIRVLPPLLYGSKSAYEIALKEKMLATPFLKKYFYFGINFMVERCKNI
jgi:SAM-dependent methyltransferase